jgi:hypothetical protein
MEDPEAWLRAITAPLARAREGSPYPVARLSLEAVANAFVVLGLLPAARAEEILGFGRARGIRRGRDAYAGDAVSSSHQTTLPAGSWVGYQSQRALRAARPARPRARS